MEKYYWMRLSIKNEKTGKSERYYYDLKDFIGRPSEWLPFVETSDVLDFLVEYKAKYIKEDEPMGFYLVCEKRIFPDDHNVDLAEVYSDNLYEGGDYSELCCVLSNLMEENRTTEDLARMIDELIYEKEKEKELNSPPISFCIRYNSNVNFATSSLEFDTSKIIQDFVDNRKGEQKLLSVVNMVELLDDVAIYQVEDFIINSNEEYCMDFSVNENRFRTVLKFFSDWYKELDKCDLDNYIEQRKATRKFIENYLKNHNHTLFLMF